MTGLRAAVVVLTMGDRGEEVEVLTRSLGPAAPDVERILVVNGGEPVPVPGWTVVHSPTNVGIPAGRNLGIAETSAPVVVLLDDDAAVVTPDLVDRCIARFAAEPHLGAIGFRIVVTGTRRSLRRWTPRFRGKRPDITGDVTAFPGGGHAFRREAFDAIGGYCDEFFYAMEETEISWRLLDAGWRISYDADLIIEHPETAPSRHSDALRLTARNRVWLARRQLPRPLAATYLAGWFAIGAARAHSRSERVAIVQGYRDGMGQLPGPRIPMRWATVWKMTRLGRPPII